MKTWIIAALLASIPQLAEAAVSPTVELNLPQSSSAQRYKTMTGNACLVLDAGRPLGDQDAAGLQKLIADLDVHAGPGLQPEAEPAGSLLYVYNLVPQLKGSTLIYRGLQNSIRGNTVKVSARGPASLNDVIARDLGFQSNARFVFSHDCE